MPPFIHYDDAHANGLKEVNFTFPSPPKDLGLQQQSDGKKIKGVLWIQIDADDYVRIRNEAKDRREGLDYDEIQ